MDLRNTKQLEQALSMVAQNAHVRIDMRAMLLPLAAMDALVAFLRRVPAASVCVGNNAFSFDAFCNKLDEMGSMDLFNTDRITTGWTDWEVAVSHKAAQARLEGRILQLHEAIDRMRMEREADYAKHEADYAKREADYAKHEADYAKREADYAKQKAEHEAYRQQEKIIHERIKNLEGYTTNGALCIEYAVTDTVDDLMREKLGYELDERQQRIKLYNEHGINVGEIDGLLMYTDMRGEKKRTVAVAVEAKSNMTPDDFKKVNANIRHLKSAIAVGMDATGDRKYQMVCRSLSVLQGADLFVAVGAPVIPDKIAADAVELSYLVVEGIREGQYQANEDSVKMWKQLVNAADE
jgi:hypothetical protein